MSESSKTLADVKPFVGDGIVLPNPNPLHPDMKNHIKRVLYNNMPWGNDQTFNIVSNMNCLGFVPDKTKGYDRDMYMGLSVEYTGVNKNIVGIGMTVISNGDIIAQILIPTFVDGIEFNETSWVRYWSYQQIDSDGAESFPNMKNLMCLHTDGNYNDILKNATLSLFVLKGYFEQLTRMANKKLYKATAHNSFETGIINELNKEYLPSTVHPNVCYSSITYQTLHDRQMGVEPSQHYEKWTDVDSLLSGIISQQMGYYIEWNLGKIVQTNYNHIIKYPTNYGNMPHNASHIIAIDLENFHRIINKIAELTWTSWTTAMGNQFGFTPRADISHFLSQF